MFFFLSMSYTFERVRDFDIKQRRSSKLEVSVCFNDFQRNEKFFPFNGMKGLDSMIVLILKGQTIYGQFKGEGGELQLTKSQINPLFQVYTQKPIQDIHEIHQYLNHQIHLIKD